MSLNKVMLIGNVGRDPEVRYLDGNGQNGQGTKVATFTLATTERYRDRNNELRENTEWHNIVAWRQSADVAEKFVKKGTQLYIEGRLRTRSYTDAQGVKLVPAMAGLGAPYFVTEARALLCDTNRTEATRAREAADTSRVIRHPHRLLRSPHTRHPRHPYSLRPSPRKPLSTSIWRVPTTSRSNIFR